MDQMIRSELHLTSDSEDFIDDYWYFSSSASHDGSSVNSIPWADDVVQQNQELWERVDRMFYGEESLPDNDIKLRTEIIEWTTHFPYFRVSGIAMPISTTNDASNNAVIPSEPYFEEILAIHPNSECNTQKSAAAMSTTARTFRHPTGDNSMPIHEQLAKDMEKCLRITSGPLLSRRTQNSRTAYCYRSSIYTSDMEHGANIMQDNVGKWQPLVHRNHNKSQLKSALERSDFDINKQYARKWYSTIDTERMHGVPYSARIIKVPALKNETGDFTALSTSSSSTAAAAAAARVTAPTAIKPNIVRIKTAALIPISRPLRNSITLPAIKITPTYIDHRMYNISALIYPETDINSTNKSLKKRSESE